jgi:hypothetical protein
MNARRDPRMKSSRRALSLQGKLFKEANVSRQPLPCRQWLVQRDAERRTILFDELQDAGCRLACSPTE